MSEVLIRIGTPDDAASIAGVLQESFIEFRELYTDDGYAATTPSADQILNRMSEGPVWLALIDGRPVATAAAVVKGESLYIRGMAVLPHARGRRLGEQLLEVIEKYSVDNVCNRLFLSTTPFLDRAIRLYERHGFRRTGDGPHDLFGTPLITMEKLVDI